MKWYKRTIPCQKCGEELGLLDFAYAGDGQLKYVFGCEKCGMVISWEPFASQLAAWAMQSDMLLPDDKPILRPPLNQKPPKSEDHDHALTEDDQKFLKDLGIEGGGYEKPEKPKDPDSGLSDSR